jgi:hypothetical protein
MSTDTGSADSRNVRKAERAIVMQLLRDDRGQRWEAVELANELADFDPALVERALVRLEGENVLERVGAYIWASRATRYMDGLELIGI